MAPRLFGGALLLVPALAVAQQPAPPDLASHHVFTLAQFTFENGTTVPNVKVV